MSRLSRILEGGAEPAPRHVRRRVGTLVVIALAALTGWAVFKHAATGDLAELEIAAGIDDLAVGIQSHDPGAYESAEDHFIDAASVSILDRYPAFLISSTRKIASPGVGTAHDEIARMVAQQDFAAARERVASLEAPAAKYWETLLEELELRLDE